ncbi:MAG TPA: hypothetical protein VIL46_17335 [Gemmataceae bacterium]
MTDRETSDSERDLPRCPCGFTRHDRDHVTVRLDHSFFGTFALIILGSSVLPKRATVRCRHCGKVIEVVRDPEVLRREFQPY